MKRGLSHNDGRWLDERFRAAAYAPHDRAALQSLQKVAGSLRNYLMTDDGRSTLVELERDVNLDWLHEIYSAISEVPDDSGGMAEEADRYGPGLAEAPAYSFKEAPARHYGIDDPAVDVHPSDREDALVGQAFEELLIGGLPRELVDVERFFADTEPVDARLETALNATPSVASAGPVAHRLTRYGITPALVVNASQAVAAAARRHYRTRRLPREREVVIDYRGVSNDPTAVTTLHRGPLCAGVQLATELAPAVSERLFDWLMGVASRKPLLLDGFRVHEVERGLLLKPTMERVDLFTAWETAASGPGADCSR